MRRVGYTTAMLSRHGLTGTDDLGTLLVSTYSIPDGNDSRALVEFRRGLSAVDVTLYSVAEIRRARAALDGAEQALRAFCDEFGCAWQKDEDEGGERCERCDNTRPF